MVNPACPYRARIRDFLSELHNVDMQPCTNLHNLVPRDDKIVQVAATVVTKFGNL
jgi:hypothetical protein